MARSSLEAEPVGATICLASRKGGVGKTSLCINLAHVLATEGLKVRVVDLDSQASLSQFYIGPEAVENITSQDTIEAIANGAKAGDLVRPTKFKRIELIPAHLKLAIPRGAELQLRSQDVDVQLIDTPPDLENPIVRAALVTSDFVLSPIVPEPFGAQSIVSLTSTLYGVAVASNPGLRLLGYLINQRQRLAIHGAVERMLRQVHGDQILATVVPSLVAFKEAIAAGQPVGLFAPKSAAAKSIAALWRELLTRIERTLTEAA